MMQQAVYFADLKKAHELREEIKSRLSPEVLEMADFLSSEERGLARLLLLKALYEELVVKQKISANELNTQLLKLDLPFHPDRMNQRGYQILGINYSLSHTRNAAIVFCGRNKACYLGVDLEQTDRMVRAEVLKRVFSGKLPFEKMVENWCLLEALYKSFSQYLLLNDRDAALNWTMRDYKITFQDHSKGLFEWQNRKLQLQFSSLESHVSSGLTAICVSSTFSQ